MRLGRIDWLGSRGVRGGALALVVGLALSGCGGSGEEVAAGATQPVTSAPATTSAETLTTTDGPPAEAPDPCTVLTTEQAATLGGVSPLTAAPAYNGAPSATTLLTEAARQVVAAIRAG